MSPLSIRLLAWAGTMGGLGLALLARDRRHGQARTTLAWLLGNALVAGAVIAARGGAPESPEELRTFLRLTMLANAVWLGVALARAKPWRHRGPEPYDPPPAGTAMVLQSLAGMTLGLAFLRFVL